MEIIVGSIIVRDNKILMVKETKEECYGKWSFPAGHLEKNESIFEGGIRETFEETGYKIKLKKVFPIIQYTGKTNVILIHFLSEIEEIPIKFDSDEIMETKWISMEELKEMKEDEVRNYDIKEQVIKNLKNNELYSIDIIKQI